MNQHLHKRSGKMNNFLISIEKGEDGFYYAFFSDGTTVDLGTNDYAVAVCSADMIESA